MTDNEKTHREFYMAMRRARGGKALRLCNRMPEKKVARRIKPVLTIAVQAPGVS